MEVFFEPTKGNSFYMRVEFSDTVEAVKEKIEELKGVPVGKQTLIYNDQILPDKTDFTRFQYFKPSQNESCLKIIVVITYVLPDRLLLTPERPDVPPPEIMKVPVMMKLPVSNLWHCIEIDITHSVKKLKEIIGTLEGVAASGIVIRHGRDNAEELDDEEILYNCGIDGFVEVKVSLRPGNSTNQTGPEKLLPKKRMRESAGDGPRSLSEMVQAAVEAVVAMGILIIKEPAPVEAAAVEGGLDSEEPAPVEAAAVEGGLDSEEPAPMEAAAVEGGLDREEPAPMEAAGAKGDLASEEPAPMETDEAEEDLDRLLITVVLDAYGVKTPVDIHSIEYVSVLRMEMERLKDQRPELVFPEGDYIKFKYGKVILEENETFLLQSVPDGAIIHVLEEGS